MCQCGVPKAVKVVSWGRGQTPKSQKCPFDNIALQFCQQYPGEQAWTKFGKGVLLLPKANGQSMPGTLS